MKIPYSICLFAVFFAAIVANAEGPYECEFDMPKFKAFEKLDAPLP